MSARRWISSAYFLLSSIAAIADYTVLVPLSDTASPYAQGLSTLLTQLTGSEDRWQVEPQRLETVAKEAVGKTLLADEGVDMLQIEFKQSVIDQFLQENHLSPWRDRPTVLMYVLDGEQLADSEQVSALLAQRGFTGQLPAEDQAPTTDVPTIIQLMHAQGKNQVLMIAQIDSHDHQYAGQWHLIFEGFSKEWTQVSEDFAAQIDQALNVMVDAYHPVTHEATQGTTLVIHGIDRLVAMISVQNLLEQAFSGHVTDWEMTGDKIEAHLDPGLSTADIEARLATAAEGKLSLSSDHLDGVIDAYWHHQ